MFWQMLPSKEVDEVGDTVSGSIGPTLTWFGHTDFDKKFASFQVLSSSNGHLSPLSVATRKTLIAQARSRESSNNKNSTRQESQSHPNNSTGRFNFRGMQNVIDLIDSDNKISTTRTDSHALWITARAPGLTVTGVRGLGPHYDVSSHMMSLQSYLCQSHVLHSCIGGITPITGQLSSSSAHVTITACHWPGMRSQLTQMRKQQQNKQTKNLYTG